MKVKLFNIISVILVLSMLMMVFPFNVMASSAYMDSNSGASESGTGINAEAMQLYGSVTGIDKNDVQNAIVLLYDSTNSYSSTLSSNAEYGFENIKEGTYFLKIELDGYKIPSPQSITISASSNIKYNLSVEKVDSSEFFFQWKADDTYFGYEESATVPSKKTFNFLDEMVYVSDSNAAIKLLASYKVILSNEDMKWSVDYSSKMFDLINEIHNFPRELPSKWVLTSEEIDDDIKIVYKEKGTIVYINKHAFENAVPRRAEMNGLKGTYFSNRLYHALIRYASKEGTDIWFIDELLKNNYGCSIIVPDYEELTRGITNETAAAFEQFKPEELLAILEMFAEMPEGFHKIPGLEYLVRRIDGQVNLIYPDAAAISWVYAEHGYIEFMDIAFLGDEVEDTFRLVLHEKTHFLWRYLFSDKLKAEWIRIGGWYETDKTESGWRTSKETEFVTAYSHDINPDEDMAESVAYYILMPDRLESRAPEKYAFIRDYIMNGEIYMTKIREDLTFEVYNLYPDYAYPGRIVGVDIDVKGAPEEDKLLTITLKLDTGGNPLYGASSGVVRIYSEFNTSYDMGFAPVDGDNSILRGEITISKYAYKGYWYTDSIALQDSNGNERFSGADNFGWKLYIDNPLFDAEFPQYVKDSMYVVMEKGEFDGHDVTYVHVKLKATDNVGIKSVYCEIANNTTNGYRMDEYGSFDNETGEGTITFLFTEFTQSGEYSINYLALIDFGENWSHNNFYSDGAGAGKNVTFNYYSEHSDYEPPEINLNNIIVNAYPTHPEAPNGETLVTIDFFARDNASGLGRCYFGLIDPMGNVNGGEYTHENYCSTFFKGNATEWKAYRISIILPEGSAPGTWGLYDFYVCDKAGNFRHYNFLEIVHFVIDKDMGDPTYKLSAEADQLTVGKSMKLSCAEADSGKAYVWECSNKTGKASISENGVLTGITPGYVTVTFYERDDNTKFGQIDILITSDAHHMGEWHAEIKATRKNCGLAVRHCTDEGCDYFESISLDILEFLVGDINGDDEVNVKDLILLAQYYAGWDVDINIPAMDINGDGETNVKDLIRLAQYLAGWDIKLN